MNSRIRMVPVLFLAITLGACDSDRILNLLPVDAISNEIAIIDGTSAQAALYGAYSALQGGSYYGNSYSLFSELMTPNTKHTGTFSSWGDADLNQVLASNGTINGMWGIMYDGINRVNNLIQKVPEIGPEDISAAEANEILGEAYGLRALHYFSLVRAWGDVPIVLVPQSDLDEAGQVSRAPAAQVWAQIESDLSQAQTFLGGIDNDDRTFITPGFIHALRARAALYQEDWPGAVSAARQLEATGDYALVDSFEDLFTPEGSPTSEDIFRVHFTDVDGNSMGFYYQLGGRFEMGATWEIYDLYPAGDLRHDVTFGRTDQDGIEVSRWPTFNGAEDFSVVRYGGILLLMAEALAEQDGAANLAEAVGYLNQIRNRAGITPYVYGVDLTTKAEVLDAVFLERRLELAFEGEYWFDLVRTGRAAAAIGANFDAHEALWPIPESELDVAPNLVQNPGY
jgi:hypothetical protein